MSTQTSWKEIFAREDIIRGDIRSVEDGCIYRGPISGIDNDGEIVRFLTPWTATWDEATQSWILWNYEPVFCAFEKAGTLPCLDKDGNITFNIQYMGKFKIRPTGNGSLNPAEVVGLDPRFLQHQG